MPNVSKPGPKFAEVAGAVTFTSAENTQIRVGISTGDGKDLASKRKAG